MARKVAAVAKAPVDARAGARARAKVTPAPSTRARAKAKGKGKAGPRAPAEMAVAVLRADALHLDPSNANTHPEANLAAIRSSLARFGQVVPILVDRKDIVRAGNGTLTAIRQLGWPTVRVVRTDLDGPELVALALAMNRTAQLAEWDPQALTSQLDALREHGIPVSDFGFSDSYVQDLKAGLLNLDGRGRPPGDGSLLKLVDVAIAEPRTRVAHGDIFDLGGRHVLACLCVVKDWRAWAPLLEGDDTLFCPYPGPYLALSNKAASHRLVLVQPDPYIAGHVADHFEQVAGEGTAVRR